MEPITAAATNATNTLTRAIWGENPPSGAQKVTQDPATGSAPATDESHSSRDTATDSSPAGNTSDGGPPKATDDNPNLPFSGSIKGVSSLGGRGFLKENGGENTGSHVSLGKTETGSYEGSSSGAYPDTHDHSPLWLGKTEPGNYGSGDPRPGDTHSTGIGRASDALGKTELGKTQHGHTEVGHSPYTNDTANRTPSDFTSGTQSHYEREGVTSGGAGILRDSGLSGTPGLTSAGKPPFGQSGLSQPLASTPTADAPPGSVAGASGPSPGTAIGPSADAPPSTGEPLAPKQQGADKPLSEPSDASYPAPSSSNPAPSGGNPVIGGMKLNNKTTGEGTGMKYKKSTGLAADGGDFDASRPGAGREADRLLEEKGIHRAHGGSTNLEDERAKKEANKFGHPHDSASGSHGSDHKEHEKLTTKIKEKLHLGHHH